jgi:hypothetical protein
VSSRANGQLRNGNRQPPGPDPLAVPPQNLEAEKGVLGAIVFDPAALDEVRAIIGPESFLS